MCVMHDEPETNSQLSELAGSEIPAEMTRRAVNQSTLADKVGEHPTWVGRRVNAVTTRRAPITLDDLDRIADALDLDPLTIVARAASVPA